MEKDPFVSQNKGYVEELEKMISSGQKMELEAMSWKGVQFLSETWLLSRIRKVRFLPKKPTTSVTYT